MGNNGQAFQHVPPNRSANRIPFAKLQRAMDSEQNLLPMHQAAAVTPIRRKRKSRRKLYIWLGIGGLILLLIIGSVISGKREKPIEVTTEKATRRTINFRRQRFIRRSMASSLCSTASWASASWRRINSPAPK